MSVDQNIDVEFREVLRLPLSIEEKMRYKDFLFRQHPEYGMVDRIALERIVANQPIAFTPSQIIRLNEKSINLRSSGVPPIKKEQELGELLACALLAEFLNKLYVLGGGIDIGIPEFQSSLFSIQSVPKPNQRPDVYIHSRSHRNKIITNLGKSEEDQPIEVTEFEHFTLLRKPTNMMMERYIADHVINAKINKTNSLGIFPYDPYTRLVVHIETGISLSSVNLNKVAKYIKQAILVHTNNGNYSFSEIYIVQFTDIVNKKGRVTQIYPYFLRKRIDFNNLPQNYPLLYVDPIFGV